MALVEATLISGPAWVYSTASASRATEDPTTLHSPSVTQPFSRASRNAASVSAVSPDWLMASTASPSSSSGSR